MCNNSDIWYQIRYHAFCFRLQLAFFLLLTTHTAILNFNMNIHLGTTRKFIFAKLSDPFAIIDWGRYIFFCYMLSLLFYREMHFIDAKMCLKLQWKFYYRTSRKTRSRFKLRNLCTIKGSPDLCIQICHALLAVNLFSLLHSKSKTCYINHNSYL